MCEHISQWFLFEQGNRGEHPVWSQKWKMARFAWKKNKGLRLFRLSPSNGIQKIAWYSKQWRYWTFLVIDEAGKLVVIMMPLSIQGEDPTLKTHPKQNVRCGQCTHITRNPEPRRVTLENQTSSDYDNSPLQFQTHYTLGRKAPTPLEAFRVCVENSDFGGAE